MTKQFTTIYRPKSFKTFYGNETVINSVKKQLEGNFPHTWLIVGDSNCGKTSLGRIIARKLLEVPVKQDILMHRDYYEINVGVDKSIEKMRTIVENMRYKPREGQYKVIMLDEAHLLSGNSASAMLKPLEEPPKHVVIILCTNEPEKLLETIRNRAYKVQLQPMPVEAIEKLLTRVVESEEIPFMSDELIKQFALNFEGQPRQALTVLQTLQNTHKGGSITKEEFKQVIVEALETDNQIAMKIIKAIYTYDYKTACQLSQEIKDVYYSLRIMQEMNHAIICRVTGAWFPSYGVYKLLWNEIKSSKIELSLPKMLALQSTLLDIKRKLIITNINMPKHELLNDLASVLFRIKGME